MSKADNKKLEETIEVLRVIYKYLRGSEKMLKIKDSVDLKELEKFGFKYIKNNNFPILSNEKYYYDYVGTINIYENTRSIIIKNTGDETINILYDLIQAGLVEKV